MNFNFSQPAPTPVTLAAYHALIADMWLYGRLQEQTIATLKEKQRPIPAIPPSRRPQTVLPIKASAERKQKRTMIGASARLPIGRIKDKACKKTVWESEGICCRQQKCNLLDLMTQCVQPLLGMGAYPALV
jgi:hypothetical protein